MLVHAKHFDKLAKAALSNSQATAAQLAEMQKLRDIQTRTLILQYRPRIIVRGAKASNFNVADLGEPARANIKFSVINTGGTPARITGGYFALWSLEATKAPAPIEFQRGGDNPIVGFDLQPGQETVLERTASAGVTNDIQWANYHQALQTEPRRYIYLVGALLYLDDLDIPRQTGINRCYDPKTRTFLPEKNSDQEYAD
jgi:hypothetical protein